MRNDWKVIEFPPEEYWGLACNAVTLEPGKVVMNAGSPIVVDRLELSLNIAAPRARVRRPPGF